MGAGHLHEGDADLMMHLVVSAYEDDPGEGMPWALLHGLLSLVPCDLVSYQHHDLTGRYTRLCQDVDLDGARYGPATQIGHTPDDVPFWDRFWQSACSWPQRNGDIHTVGLLTDLLPTRASRHADPVHGELSPEIRDEVRLSLTAPPGQARRILFMRDYPPPFTERDRQVVSLLRPHIEEIWRTLERLRAGTPQLTPREWEVLSLVANGMTAAEVAGALFLSPATVRKHVENVRVRLGVHTAAAAAALALPHPPAIAARARSPEHLPRERA